MLSQKACSHLKPFFLPPELYDVIEKGEEESVQFFNDWVAEVKKNVPEDRLLLFQAKEGRPAFYTSVTVR